MKYCIANWKMNMNRSQARYYVETLSNLYFGGENWKNSEVIMIICPPYTLLETIARAIPDKYIKDPGFLVGVQNFHPENKGAYTGEVSLSMIKPARYVIIGHSERRSLFNESDKFINLKVKAALDNDFSPILCIGETLEEREAGKTKDVLRNQLKECLKDISCSDDFLIAYEPVWAIGTGKTANNDTIEPANDMILNIIKDLKCNIENPKILYGGSVNNNNAKNLSKICNLDGFLIGGASLDAEQFYSIYNALKGE